MNCLVYSPKHPGIFFPSEINLIYQFTVFTCISSEWVSSFSEIEFETLTHTCKEPYMFTESPADSNCGGNSQLITAIIISLYWQWTRLSKWMIMPVPIFCDYTLTIWAFFDVANSLFHSMCPKYNHWLFYALLNSSIKWFMFCRID